MGSAAVEEVEGVAAIRVRLEELAGLAALADSDSDSVAVWAAGWGSADSEEEEEALRGSVVVGEGSEVTAGLGGSVAEEEAMADSEAAKDLLHLCEHRHWICYRLWGRLLLCWYP